MTNGATPTSIAPPVAPIAPIPESNPINPDNQVNPGLTRDAISPLLEIIRGDTIYGENPIPKFLSDLGYVFAKTNCDGAILDDPSRIVLFAASLNRHGVLQCASALAPTLAAQCNLYLTKVINNSVYLYRKN